MYDMYPWDSANQGEYPPRPLRSVKNSRPAAKATSTAPATVTATASAAARRDFSPAQAVQFALDRRDNGGEAEQAATLPAASQARQ
ncbi:MAG TPA: hypothetical protein VGI96_25395 [Streptosporangiaceae bacterium]|jgi:hypothetical protein